MVSREKERKNVSEGESKLKKVAEAEQNEGQFKVWGDGRCDR